MKRCPECRRDYYDDTLLYCLDDGNALLEGPTHSPTIDLHREALTMQLPSDWNRLFGTRRVPTEGTIDGRRCDLNSLIGRDVEVAAIAALLTAGQSRLVTLTGIGGTGKTRLSIEAAHRLQPQFPDGVFFIELSRIDDERLVAPAIAHTIGLDESGRRDVFAWLAQYLKDRSVLLVLDNMEHVVEGGVQLAGLLAETTKLKLLVTSREALGLSGETEYCISPLAVPSQGDEPSVGELRACESVLLFIERAQGVWPDFELSEDNAQTISAICRKLDGIPLAIELAAARAKVLSSAEILARLEDSLSLLTGGARDLPDRQQTMRAAIHWSYDLLTDAEKIAFCRLAVFAGGFTLHQAEAVIADNEIRESEVLDIITSLSGKSLLVTKREGQGETRFRMLQLVRDFAIELLTTIDADRGVRRSHAEYFLQLAEGAVPHLAASDSAEWLERLENDHDNFRSAIQWALASDIEIAARLMASLRSLWTIRGHIREGRSWFENALEEKADELPAALRWELLTGLGNMAQFQGDYSCSRDAYMRSLEDARTANDQKKVARSLRGLGALEYIQCDMASARERIVEAREISETLGDEFGIAAALSRLGDIGVAEGRPDEGRRHIRESLERFRNLGYKIGIMTTLNNLATAELLLGETESARIHLRESVATSSEMGDRINLRTVLEGFAALMFIKGEYQSAAQVCGAASSLGETIGVELEPVERRLVDLYAEGLREAMAETDFEDAFTEGRRMNVEDAIKFVLDWEINKAEKV
jgi:predicted ATPase